MQYSLPMAGKLLLRVFLCFQKPVGKFGPVMQRRDMAEFLLYIKARESLDF